MRTLVLASLAAFALAGATSALSARKDAVSLTIRRVFASSGGFEVKAEASHSYDDGCWSGSLDPNCQYAVPVTFELHRGRTVYGTLISQVESSTYPGTSSLQVRLPAQLPRYHRCVFPRWREIKRYYSILATATFPRGETQTATDRELIVVACRR